MLTKQCKDVLKSLDSLSGHSECELTFLGGHTFIARSDNFYLTFDYVDYQNEIHGIIDQLVMDGYAVYTTSRNDFRLTQKALREKQLIFQTVRSIAIKEVLIPIAVSIAASVITTFITLWISGLKLPWQ